MKILENAIETLILDELRRGNDFAGAVESAGIRLLGDGTSIDRGIKGLGLILGNLQGAPISVDEFMAAMHPAPTVPPEEEIPGVAPIAGWAVPADELGAA